MASLIFTDISLDFILRVTCGYGSVSCNKWILTMLFHFSTAFQVKKTWGATLTTLQDMTVLDDFDVSQSFTHSPSSESVKSSVSDGYLNKPSLAKRRANQQETELFYFSVSPADQRFWGGFVLFFLFDTVCHPKLRILD